MESKQTLVVFMLASLLVIVGFSANEKAYATHVAGSDVNGHIFFGDFTCWAAVPGNFVNPGTVKIADQFVEEEIVTSEPWEQAEFCTATEKDGEESPFSAVDLNQHYQAWYYTQEVEPEGFFETEVILYVPQFRHSFLAEIGLLDQLMIPATKKFASGNEISSVDTLQHWNCYDIIPSSPVITDNVDLLTENGTITDVRIDDAFLLCNPAEKDLNGGGFNGNPELEEHLVCYDITVEGVDNVGSKLPVQLDDQFTPGFIPFPRDLINFAPLGLEKLCVTAEKRFPTVGGTDVSINSSALLLAGVQSVSMWMIPVVIAGIGIGIFVIKRRNSSNLF